MPLLLIWQMPAFKKIARRGKMRTHQPQTRKKLREVSEKIGKKNFPGDRLDA